MARIVIRNGGAACTAPPFRLEPDKKGCNFAVTIDQTHVESEWYARGFRCGLWVDPPGQVWEDYVHASDELLMVLEGELELEMRGRTFRPRNGEEILIPARETHSVRNVGSTVARWLYGYKNR